MKFLLATLLTALLSFIAGIFLPWWSIAIIAFLISLVVRQSMSRSFLAGFAGIFLLWSLVALWIDIKKRTYSFPENCSIVSTGWFFIFVDSCNCIGRCAGRRICGHEWFFAEFYEKP